MGYDKVLGGGENVTEEVNVQTPLIEDILANLVGKVSGANIIPEAVLEGYSGYKGQELVEGILPDNLRDIRHGIATFDNQQIRVNHGLGIKPKNFIMVLVDFAHVVGRYHCIFLTKSDKPYFTTGSTGFYNPRLINNNNSSNTFEHDSMQSKDTHMKFDDNSFWYETTNKYYGTYLWIAIA